MHSLQRLNTLIQILTSNLLEEITDAIVVPISGDLSFTSILAQKVFERAGPTLNNHKQTVMEKRNHKELAIADCVECPSANLPSGCILFTVGPYWSNENVNTIYYICLLIN